MMEMLQFLQKKLFCKNPETKDLEDSVLAIYLKTSSTARCVSAEW